MCSTYPNKWTVFLDPLYQSTFHAHTLRQNSLILIILFVLVTLHMSVSHKKIDNKQPVIFAEAPFQLWSYLNKSLWVIPLCQRDPSSFSSSEQLCFKGFKFSVPLAPFLFMLLSCGTFILTEEVTKKSEEDHQIDDLITYFSFNLWRKNSPTHPSNTS